MDKIAVCGGRFEDESQVIRVEYQGNVYFLCDNVCLKEFHENPDRFLVEHAQDPAE